jgi:hypothetical protein
MFWQGALPRKFVNFKVQNEECHYYDATYDVTKWIVQKTCIKNNK